MHDDCPVHDNFTIYVFFVNNFSSDKRLQGYVEHEIKYARLPYIYIACITLIDYGNIVVQYNRPLLHKKHRKIQEYKQSFVKLNT